MRNILLFGGLFCVVAWLYLLLFHGRFWQVGRLQVGQWPITGISGSIVVVMPARNEAENIGRAMGSLLKQTCANSLRIYVVDDNSSDGTADAVRVVASNAIASGQLVLLSGSPLPDDWTGKLWAVQQGVEAALAENPQFLLLTDADIEHAPDNLAILVSIAERDDYDLVSFMVKLHCRSFAEKLLVPPFVFFFFMLYPPLWIRSPHKRIAGAAGGCMLIRTEALERAGGIAAIRSEIIDDCALARRIKQSGGRVWLGLAADTHSVRTYETFGEVERMIARTAFNQLQHSGALLCGAVAGMTLVFILPLILLLTGDARLTALGLAAYGVMVVTYFPMVRFYGLELGWALTLPFSAIFYLGATLDSAVKHWRGRGAEWKGRSHDRRAGCDESH